LWQDNPLRHSTRRLAIHRHNHAPYEELTGFKKLPNIFSEQSVLNTGHEYNTSEPGGSPARRPARRGPLFLNLGCDETDDSADRSQSLVAAPTGPCRGPL